MLLCTSNGVGLGHVTRMMALAHALQTDVDASMFTLSAALPIPVATGMHVEHLASVGQFGTSAPQWNDLLAERLGQLVHAMRPDAVVFDGFHPYRGLRSALHDSRRRTMSVWVRRGMWKPDVANDDAALAELGRPFDHIIEPGDFAAEYDHGITSRHRDDVDVVTPVVYTAPQRHPDRKAACAELGLRTERTNVLVQLGAGQINDVTSATGAVIASLARHPGVTPTVARSVLSAPGVATDPAVIEVQHFPITRFVNAFDAAVVAAGYNSFHEMLSLGVPTIIVPNLHTRTDDQDARTRWAHDRGLGIRWDGESAADLDEAVDALVSASHRSTIRARLAGLGPANGAAEAAQLIRGWLR